MSPRLPTSTILAANLPYPLQALPRSPPLQQLPTKLQPQPQPQPQLQPQPLAPGIRTYPRSWRSPGLNESEGLLGPIPAPDIPPVLPLPHPIRDIWLLLAGSAHPEDIPPSPPSSLVGRATDGTQGSGRASLPKPMPCSSLFPQAPGCLSAPKEKPHGVDIGPSCHLCSSCCQGLTTECRGD